MKADDKRRETLAILVGGGPAPGINGVISSAAIEAINCGLRVVGLRDGYRWLVEGDTSHVVELKLDEVSQVHSTGGSILRTSRTNPARDEAGLQRAIGALETLGIRYLVCIGGDDTTYGAYKIAERTRGKIGVVTVPKTIDNDLPLPENAPTFGFETARSVGVELVSNLMTDAITTQRGLNEGLREMNPVMRPFVTRGAAGEAAGSALGYGAAVGVVYLLHRTHHYRAERITMRLMVAGEGGFVANNLIAIR